MQEISYCTATRKVEDVRKQVIKRKEMVAITKILYHKTLIEQLFVVTTKLN